MTDTNLVEDATKDYASVTFTSLSLWLALSTITLASRCSVASLELQLA